MEPFKVSEKLRGIIDAYPDARLIAEAAREGGEAAKQAIARQWLSEGIPFAFKDCPGMYESVRTWLAVRLSVDPKEINITGSARLGQSIAPKKIGSPFGNGSDLDIFVVSDALFERLKKDFNAWSYQFQCGALNPKNPRELHFWNENVGRGERSLSRGFIDTKIIPNYESFACAQNVAQTMFMLLGRLENSISAPQFSDASVRCYNSWSNYSRQVTMGL